MDVTIILLFSEFLFHLIFFACLRIKFLFSMFIFNCNFDFFLSVITNSQTECTMIYQKIVIQVGDDE